MGQKLISSCLGLVSEPQHVCPNSEKGFKVSEIGTHRFKIKCHLKQLRAQCGGALYFDLMPILNKASKASNSEQNCFGLLNMSQSLFGVIFIEPDYIRILIGYRAKKFFKRYTLAFFKTMFLLILLSCQIGSKSDVLLNLNECFFV